MRVHTAILIAGWGVFCTQAHDIVEALVFEDDTCSKPLGRMKLVADGRCRCVECGRWENPRATETVQIVQNLTPNSLTQSMTLNTFTDTVTNTEPTTTLSDTISMTVVSSTEVLAMVDVYIPPSSEISRHALSGVLRGMNCTACNLFPLSFASAACHGNRTFSLTFRDIDDCTPVSTVSNIAVSTTSCVSLGDGLYGLLAKSTCQPEDDDDMTDLELALVIVLAVGTVLLGGIVGYIVWVWKNLRMLLQIRSDVQKTAKDDAALREQVLKTTGKVAEQTNMSSKVADEVEGITGNSVLTNGLIGSANSVAPPSLPIREELDQLSAHMAHVESEIDMQKKMMRDAMI